ncbi:MAG TPA: RluA family pseudouridine synthase [Thermomicrobiales bacterium]|nr:RluA family pseudouridine synthase [Thermomicrobiales bacterium]
MTAAGAGARRETLRVEPAEAGQRLDRALAARLPDRSRAALQALIDGGNVLVDGRARKASYRLRAGEAIAVTIPPPAPADLRPEAIPLAIVYEDADVLVIDKPAGMVVHPAPGHASGTVVNAVLAHAPDVHVKGTARPGLVHRLDRDTSGLLVVAKHERALAALQRQFKERHVRKVYLALLDGVVEPDEGTIDAPIGRDPRNRQRMAVLREGRPAVSHFRVLERLARHTLVEVRIESGRTHQIRVHGAFIGHPVAGDLVYRRGGPDDPALPRQFLHAHRLGFTLLGGDWREFVSPLPPDLAGALAALRGSRQSSVVGRQWVES